MSSVPPSPPPPPPPGPRGSDKRELLDAFEQLVSAEQERARTPAAPPAPPRHRTGRLVLVGLTLLLYGLLAGVWLVRPAWLFAPDTPPPLVTPALREAHLRYAMYLQAHAIMRFLEDRGRLPDSLEELEDLEATEGVAYSPDGQAGWRLVAEDGPVRLELRSGESLDAFLGTSLQLLNARR